MQRVVGAVLIRNGKVLLLRKKGGDIWWFIGGKEEEGENEKKCLLREVHEELDCTAVRYRKIGDFVGNGWPANERIILSCWLIGVDCEHFCYGPEHDGMTWVRGGEVDRFHITEATRLCLEHLIKIGLL